MSQGTTLAQVVTKFDVHARAGALVAVDGSQLVPDAFPGHIELDGKPVPAETKLHDDDTVSVIAGRNRREATTRQVVAVPGGMPANPQFFVARTPGRQIVVRGKTSHKLVSVTFQPTGHTKVARAVALTFDDGPSPEYTPRILATLRRLHAKATFFVIGYLADQYRSVVRKEIRAGMTVGNHTFNHPEVPPFDEQPRKLVDVEISLGAASVGHAGGTATLFRPPEGSFTGVVVPAAKALGERVVLWSVDPADWEPSVTTTSIVRNVLTHVRPGSIVILHDGGGDRSATVAALPAIVKGIRARGLKLVAL